MDETFEMEMALAKGAPISEAKVNEAKGIASCLIDGMVRTQDLLKQKELVAIMEAEWAAKAEPIDHWQGRGGELCQHRGRWQGPATTKARPKRGAR